MSPENIKTILFMGKTGSGKGTQAALVAKVLGFQMFSSGDAFRAIREKDTELGRRVKAEYEAGVWFPHWFASYLFENILLNLPDGGGVVFEGVGRRKEEAILFDEVAEWLGRAYVVFNLMISDEESQRRQALRQRDVLDTPEKIEKRLQQYKEHTTPALEFFRSRGRVIDVNGEQSIKLIHQIVMDSFSAL